MAQKSPIEWTDSTWNPVTGCTKISSGCLNCYAERMAKRLKAMGQKNYSAGFAVTLQPQALELPLSWKKPHRIFVNSMSDLFHEDVPLEFVKKVFDVMKRAHWHEFQVLTKRADRLAELAPELDWPENVWMGVTVESSEYVSRIDLLRTVPAHIKFLSNEPLLTAIPSMNLDGIDWVIVGGESGPKSRVVKEEWVLDIKNQCEQAKVPFFFKQWGGTNKKKAGHLLNGRVFKEMPSLEVKENNE